jgi:hypothetical protein
MQGVRVQRVVWLTRGPREQRVLWPTCVDPQRARLHTVCMT